MGPAPQEVLVSSNSFWNLWSTTCAICCGIVAYFDSNTRRIAILMCAILVVLTVFNVIAAEWLRRRGG